MTKIQEALLKEYFKKVNEDNKILLELLRELKVNSCHLKEDVENIKERIYYIK